MLQVRFFSIGPLMLLLTAVNIVKQVECCLDKNTVCCKQ